MSEIRFIRNVDLDEAHGLAVEIIRTCCDHFKVAFDPDQPLTVEQRNEMLAAFAWCIESIDGERETVAYWKA